MSTANDLADKQCKSCEGGVPPLTGAEANILFQQIQGWQLQSKLISKTYAFKNYYQTMAFVNAVAWVSHREDHHPDMVVDITNASLQAIPRTLWVVCLKTISFVQRKSISCLPFELSRQARNLRLVAY